MLNAPDQKCFKCSKLIDEILNIDSRVDVGQFMYICEKCAEVTKPKQRGETK